jgi:hypothetical protein
MCLPDGVARRTGDEQRPAGSDLGFELGAVIRTLNEIHDPVRRPLRPSNEAEASRQPESESLVRLLVCETPPFRSRQDRTTRTEFGRGRLWVMAVHAERPVARRQTAYESLSRQADRADTRASENRQADRVHGPAPDNRKREPRSRRREASRYRACGVALLEQTGLERPDQPLLSGAHRN